MISSINEFYAKYAHLYERLSDDRDFDKELESLSRLDDCNSKHGGYLELFAGPASHAQSAKGLGYTKVKSVDSSPHMKRLALKSGLSTEEFLVGSLPEALADVGQEKYSLVTVLRYSIGYLARTEVVELFVLLKGLLVEGGVFFIELHDAPALFEGYSDLDIKERRCFLEEDDCEIVCKWPSGKVELNPNDWLVDMPVTLDWVRGDHIIDSLSLTSREHIYMPDEVIRLADQAGGFVAVDIPESVQDIFARSRLVGFRKIS